MPDPYILPAHAKINLTLDVTGLAPNGYHTLDMVMQTVSLADMVTLEESDGLALACPAWLPCGEQNIAWKAAVRLREHTGINKGVRITLDKRIPAEAGLGGGSADAAAVLKGLNELWDLGLTPDELILIGLGLGSDVPFALTGGTARVRGVGEIVERVGGAPPLWCLLAKPAGGIPTVEAYRRYDETGAGRRPDTARFIEALKRGDIEGMAAHGGNALQNAALELLPDIGDVLIKMEKKGAGYCAMTGSGAAVFGVFRSETEARAAQVALHDVPWTEVAYTAI